jgi:hypothetical protein
VVVYRALAHRMNGRPAFAADILRPALAAMTAPRELAVARLEMARIHLALGQPVQALDLLRLLPPRDTTRRPSHAEADLVFGRAWLASGQAAQALPYLQRSDAFWRGDEKANPRRAGEAASWLATALQAQGQVQASRDARRRADQLLARSSRPREQSLRSAAFVR